jgi:hypothetical protein
VKRRVAKRRLSRLRRRHYRRWSRWRDDATISAHVRALVMRGRDKYLASLVLP